MNIGDTYAGLQLITPPSVEPLTLADAEAFLRVVPDGGEIDQLISAYITTIRQHIEQSILKRALLTQTWRLSLKNWPGRDYRNYPLSVTSEIDYYYKYNYIKLPFAPLQSVSSVQYMNSSGVTQSMNAANFSPSVSNSYNVLTTMEPGRIVLPYAGIWPTDVLMPGAPITITFVAGFASLTALQNWEGYGPTIQAMKLMLADCYENRIPPDAVGGGEQVGIASKWLTPYRIYD